jgi:hypothetical protein
LDLVDHLGLSQRMGAEWGFLPIKIKVLSC